MHFIWLVDVDVEVDGDGDVNESDLGEWSQSSALEAV